MIKVINDGKNVIVLISEDEYHKKSSSIITRRLSKTRKKLSARKWRMS